MSNKSNLDPAREEADKILRMLANKEPAYVYKVVMYVTLSLFIHESKERANQDSKVSWPDWMRVVGNNYLQQLKQHLKRTADARDDVVSSNIIALPPQRKIIQ